MSAAFHCRRRAEGLPEGNLPPSHGLFCSVRVDRDLDWPGCLTGGSDPTYGTAPLMTPPRPLPFLALVLLFAAPAARADEGMWTFDNFPSSRVQKAYGF